MGSFSVKFRTFFVLEVLCDLKNGFIEARQSWPILAEIAKWRLLTL